MVGRFKFHVFGTEIINRNLGFWGEYPRLLPQPQGQLSKIFRWSEGNYCWKFTLLSQNSVALSMLDRLCQNDCCTTFLYGTQFLPSFPLLDPLLWAKFQKSA